MIVGERKNKDNVLLIETNIDDMNLKAFEYVIERLQEKGALDVWFTNIQMKKQGLLLLSSSVIVGPSSQSRNVNPF